MARIRARVMSYPNETQIADLDAATPPWISGRFTGLCAPGFCGVVVSELSWPLP